MDFMARSRPCLKACFEYRRNISGSRWRRRTIGITMHHEEWKLKFCCMLADGRDGAQPVVVPANRNAVMNQGIRFIRGNNVRIL